MPAIAVPLIVAAASTGGSIYAAKKQSDALNNATAASKGIAGQQMDLSKQLLGQGMPGVQAAQGYYSTLLSGNRGAMRNAVAGPTAAITDQYRGAMTGLERSGIRGGVRDLAKAELSRDQAGKIAGLTTGVQPAAAAGLGDISSNLISGGTSNLSNAARTSGDVMSQSLAMSRFNIGQNTANAAAVGSLWADLLRQIASKKSPSGGGLYPVGGGSGQVGVWDQTGVG